MSSSGTAAIDPRNVLLTGIPRSGTTLTCHLLNRLPDVVALHEPMNVAALALCPDGAAVCDQIANYFRRMRRMIRWRGVAVSKHAGGVVPDNPVTTEPDATGQRPLIVTPGTIRIDKPFSAQGVLAIKHPAAFTAILAALRARFRIYAIVRNPIATLGSWNSVPFQHRQGHAPAAERLNGPLRRALASIDDDDDRQLFLLSWFFQQYQQYLAAECVIRYEDLVASHGAALAVIHPGAAHLNVALEDRNVKNVYDLSTIQRLGKKLLGSEGSYWQYYSRASVAAMLPNR
ncbi:MAG: hypothetical protein A2W31_00085 [Planctomycetes bacterium RBG_16_64_10]|nr:MAG: hypothetical protein A2W31_00085 [Planctomycetes bacterium RBG_16_64_10]